LENHYARLEKALRNYLIPVFGDKYLHEITTKMIEDYKATRSRSHYRKGSKTKSVTEATINREICCIKVILRKVIEWGRIEDLPARAVKALKEKPNLTRLLEQYEVARLLESTPDRLRALIACTVYNGLRYNELLHLQWKDID